MHCATIAQNKIKYAIYNAKLICYNDMEIVDKYARDTKLSTLSYKGVNIIMTTDSFLISVDRQYLHALSVTSLIKNIKKIGLSPNELFLYLFISHLESEGEEIPTQSELAELMGISDRKLKYILVELKDKNLLEISGKGSGIVYNFNSLKNKIRELEVSV